MSVYTTVTEQELDAWLARYSVGGLSELKPIVSGIENTNYFVTTEKGRYVLTLYERVPGEELPFYLNLMAHLARNGVQSPAPEIVPAVRVAAEAAARPTTARWRTPRKATRPVPGTRGAKRPCATTRG